MYTLEQLRWGQKFTSNSDNLVDLLIEAVDSIEENFAIPLSIVDSGGEIVWSRNANLQEKSISELKTLLDAEYESVIL